MQAPATTDEFLDLVRRSGLIEEADLTRYLESLRAAGEPPDSAKKLARAMVRDGLLTQYQSAQLLLGKWRGFVLAGKYKLLEHLGSGGMSSVFLCEHTAMRRRVAIKVLPTARAKDPSYLERFYREARAVGALDHPNIVRAHDVVHDGALHFLVIEYIDGSNLQDIVRRHGPLDPIRAAHYIAQAALGLQHAHEHGLVHRDVKPGNLLVDRQGTVKVLDLGLARFFHDQDDNLSKRYDETVLGTADYLSPEQALDSSVDIRADIYSLGATFYYCLTGQTLFGPGTAAQKLIWHQVKAPAPLREIRPEVPEELAELIETRMLAKSPAERFQLPVEVAEALEPWTQTPIPPPPEEEMPTLSPGAQRSGPGEPNPSSSGATTRTPTSGIGATKRSTPSTRVSATPGPASGVNRRREKMDSAVARTAIQEEAPKPRRSGAQPLPATDPGIDLKAAPGRRSMLPWVIAAVAVLVAGGLGVAAWQLYFKEHGTSRDRPRPQIAGRDNTPDPQPVRPVQPAVPVADNIAIQADKGVRRVRTPRYEAVVEPDGCLTSLRIGGTEFLYKGGKVSRGSYFFRQAALKLPTINQPAGNVLTAQGDQAAVRYEFGRDTLAWTVTNSTDAPLTFFIVFNAGVRAVQTDKGAWARTPDVNGDWKTTTWYAGPARLKVTGSNRLWGPFEDRSSVWEARLAPRESRRLVLEPGTASAAEQARVAAVVGERRFKSPKYEALVEADGCLTSLRVGGTEFLWAAGRTGRGIYFHDGKTLQLPTVAQPAANVITAQGPAASIRYEFGPDALTLDAANTGGKGLSFFMVFGPAVKAVRSDKGDWAATPTRQPWTTTTWYAGKAKLTITGGNTIWGPWGEKPGQEFQVWAAGLKPGEKRRVVIKVGAVTGPEAARVASLTGTQPAVPTDLAVTAPLDYQVFQRYSRLRGQASLKGQVRVPCDKLEVRVTGTPLEGKLPGKWEEVPLDGPARTFDMTLPLPAGGWYKLELRALKGQKTVAENVVDHVGIGEVFVIAGQSNSTNCGEERQKQQSGKVATFGGSGWRLADDPQPGVHDRTGGGSPWPAFGDALVAKLRVPVGIASTGHSGSSVRQWQPGGEYFKWMMTRIKQLGTGGFRAVLWHQGESDVGLTADEYARLMTAVIRESRKQAGWDFPWFVAQVSYHNPGRPSFPTVRAGQQKLWDAKVALQGPDTDTLTGDNRDGGGKGIHFSGKGLRAHGKLWADKVGAYLDKAAAD